MINLLPDWAEKAIVEQKKKTLILIFQAALGLFSISLGLTLLVFQIYLESEIGYQKVLLLDKQEWIKGGGVSDLQKTVTNINNRLTRVSAFYQDQTDLSGILDRVNQKLPVGSYLTNFSFSREKKPARVSLFGFSSSREGLMSFRQSLETNEGWQNVNFPPENWVSAKDINFSVSFDVP